MTVGGVPAAKLHVWAAPIIYAVLGFGAAKTISCRCSTQIVAHVVKNLALEGFYFV